jgi:hypothetical protein
MHTDQKNTITDYEMSSQNRLILTMRHICLKCCRLEPLLQRIKEKRSAVLVPIIDVIDDKTLEYMYSKSSDFFQVRCHGFRASWVSSLWTCSWGLGFKPCLQWSWHKALADTKCSLLTTSVWMCLLTKLKRLHTSYYHVVNSVYGSHINFWGESTAVIFVKVTFVENDMLTAQNKCLLFSWWQ